jgi:dynein heavy chain
MFIEMEDHQMNLEILQTNQSAGSFLDEIAKWQSTLQHIEGVLQQWNSVQQLWLKIDCLNPLIQFDAQTNLIFLKADRDFRSLMISVANNNNVLKCCQKKSKKFFFNFFLLLKYFL